LKDFREAYEAYLSGGPDGPAELRREVVRKIPRAQDVFDLVGGSLMVRDPPAAGSAMVYHGLENVAFLHERPGFRLSEPPIYEAVIDSVESALVKLERRAERFAQAEREQPVFCPRGHLLGRTPEDAPGYCGECGAPALSGCVSCGAPVPVRADDPDKPVGFCRSCGAAFPWVDRQGRIYRLENMLAEEGLDEATELAVREQLDALANPDLSDEEQRRRWERVKDAAPGLWRRGANVIEGLAAAAIRQELGL
jgi:hypothetical protein